MLEILLWESVVSYPLTVSTNGTIQFEVQGVVKNFTESYVFF